MAARTGTGARSTSRSIAERVFESLMLAADHLLRGEVEVLRAEDLTFPQYNVLRILRGARPKRPSCGAIAQQMVTRDSDLTRLLDRLEERGLVSRMRDENDRRIVIAEITADGLTLLRRLDGTVDRVHREQLKHMTSTQLETLKRLADTVRDAGA